MNPDNKPVLLLLHGALASAKQFDPIIPFLESHFTVHALSFEGHGGNPITRNFSIKHFVQNLEQTILVNGWKSINIFGYSMGGYVALKAALGGQTKIANIVTLATKFDWSEETTNREIQMLDPTLMLEKVPHYAERLRTEHQPVDWMEVMTQTAGMMQRLAEGERLTETDLKDIATSVYIGIGNKDRMVSISESQWAANHLQNAHVEVLEGVEHPLQKFEPTILADWIKKSLNIK